MTQSSSPLPRVLLETQPAAHAWVHGNDSSPDLQGEILFYPWQEGTLLLARVAGLPQDGFFGFHIHELGNCCTGGDVPFFCAGGHYNPSNHDHPDHAGDLPVLLASGGRAFTVFFTGRFRPEEVIGRSVVIHEHPDDYHSQPAGDSGGRIACGVIEAVH